MGRAVEQEVKSQDSKHRWIFLSSRAGDLTDPKEVDRIIALYKPAVILHLAAYVGGLFKNMKEPVEFWHRNVEMNNNVLKYAHKHGVRKVISCLSTCIFPDALHDVLDESIIHAGPPHFSNAPYAYAKRMIDVVNRAYNSQYGSLFTSVIPTNIYGPNDNFHLEDAHVIPALIHKFYLAKQSGLSELKLKGTGEAKRQFIYSSDLAKLLIWAVENYTSVNPLILSTDLKDEVTIQELATLIAKQVEFKGRIIFEDKGISGGDGQIKKTASNARLREYLPKFEFTSLEKGIQETVEWFQTNYSICRK